MLSFEKPWPETFKPLAFRSLFLKFRQLDPHFFNLWHLSLYFEILDNWVLKFLVFWRDKPIWFSNHTLPSITRHLKAVLHLRSSKTLFWRNCPQKWLSLTLIKINENYVACMRIKLCFKKFFLIHNYYFFGHN